jgi:ribosome-associated toxin RatA of RatAB toxin-antitoxin module
MENVKTKNVTTTIIEDDYEFLKRHNLQVSAALSIGVQAIRKMFDSNVIAPMQNEDRDLVNRLITENRRVLKRLGEADETKK